MDQVTTKSSCEINSLMKNVSKDIKQKCYNLLLTYYFGTLFWRINTTWHLRLVKKYMSINIQNRSYLLEPAWMKKKLQEYCKERFNSKVHKNQEKHPLQQGLTAYLIIL